MMVCAVTQASFLTLPAKPTYLVGYVNWDRSGESHNDENLIKPKNSVSFEAFGQCQESMKRE